MVDVQFLSDRVKATLIGVTWELGISIAYMYQEHDLDEMLIEHANMRVRRAQCEPLIGEHKYTRFSGVQNHSEKPQALASCRISASSKSSGILRLASK